MKKVLIFALGLFMALGVQMANAAEFYGYRVGSSLYIHYDNNKSAHEGAQSAPQYNADPGWRSIAESYSIKTIIFDASVKNARPTSTSYWFRYMDVTSIVNLNYLNTSDVTEMTDMFRACVYLESLDLSNFNTSKVVKMDYMFQQCYNLTELDLTSFDFSSLRNANNMFEFCDKLKTIKCNQDWNKLPGAINGLIESDDMFTYCNQLKGGKGTTYDSNHVNKGYARPDAPGFPGYFTGTFCPTATNIAAKDMTTSSARITWSQDSRQQKYEIRYWKKYNHEGYYYEENITGTSHTLTNLEPNTTYEVWMVSECDNGYGVRKSVESNVKEFTTLAECPAPQMVNVSDIQTTSAKVSWAGYLSDKSWRVCYMHPLDIGYSYYDTNITSYTLTDLQPDTEYDVWVIGFCDAANNYAPQSLKSETIHFKTAKSTEGVEDIQAGNVRGAKLIRDGHLFIEINGTTYDAQGKEVK